MRITHIGTSDVPVLHRYGGALGRRIIEMARLQAAAGHEVRVLTPAVRDGVEVVDGVEVHSMRLRSRRPARDFEFLARARRWAHGRRAGGVLHAHGAPMAATALRKQFAAAVHSVDYFAYRGTHLRWAHRCYESRLLAFDLHMAASAYCAAEFKRFYPRAAARTRVLYNGVNRQQFRPDPGAAEHARQALGLPPGPLVVYLGRVCLQKGSDLLVPLARHLREAAPDAVVVAAGPPERFTRREPSALMTQLSDQGVRCLGAVDESLLPGLLGAAAVSVLPTRQAEMFGMAALEALACGAPVVAADLGGIPEAVGPGALLFPPGDAAAFTRQVTRLLSEPDLAQRLALAAKQHVATLDWAAIVDRSMDHYREALR
ncbi:glycosyltransferase family 4 protein [Actinoplanes sp. NPDC024001]|uniref:glycosyltransferase family 4 protein n=1 Tax=Actinoplanes sp. NPDC024001 TaxID=3154598 RepID=UPI0033C49544